MMGAGGASRGRRDSGGRRNSLIGGSRREVQASASLMAEHASVSSYANLYMLGKQLAEQVSRDRQILGRKAASMREENGLPVREGLSTMYKIARDKTIKELVVFVLFFGLFVLITLMIYDVHESFETNTSLRELLLEEPFEGANFDKNFNDIQSHEDLWDWLDGPVLDGLYPTEWYNGDPFGPAELGYALHVYRVVGGVQLRQVRVRNDSCEPVRPDDCTVHANPWTTEEDCFPRFGTRRAACFAPFSSAAEDRQPLVRGGEVFEWSDGWSELDGLFGFGEEYGTGGYTVDLAPAGRNGAAARLQDLRGKRWTDAGTRAVLLQANLYNTNTRRLTVVRCLVEFFPTGKAVKSTRFYTIPMVLYDEGIDMLRVVLEVIFVVFMGYFALKQIKRFHRSPSVKGYFSHKDNIYEIAMLAVLTTMIVLWILYVANSRRREFDVNATPFQDWFDVAWLYIEVATQAGVTGLIGAIKLFQYMNINRQMNVLWLTLSRAMVDLLAFTVSFFVVVGAFAFMGEMTFGYILQEFKSFQFAFATLLRYPLGDFRYDDLSMARPEMAGAFFTFYVALVFLVVMNIIIAIVTKYFDEVHDDVKTQDRWKASSRSIEADLGQRLSRWARVAKRWVRQQCDRWQASCCRQTEEEEEEEGGESGAPAARGPGSPARPQLRGRSASVYAMENAEENTDLELQTWIAEARFQEALHNCMRQAKRVHDIDLYGHFQSVYQEAGNDDFLFIEWEELVDLTERGGSTECPPPAEAHPDIVATKLLRAYNELKEVLMVGRCVKHERVLDECRHFNFKSYSVWKVRSSGARMRRTIYVDDEKAQLLNFRKDKLAKRLPLTQLVQMEQYPDSDAALGLVFTSQGVPLEDEETMGKGGLETIYRLEFPMKERAEEFFAHVRAVKADLHRRTARLEKQDGEQDNGTEGAPPMLTRLKSTSSAANLGRMSRRQRERSRSRTSGMVSSRPLARGMSTSSMRPSGLGGPMQAHRLRMREQEEQVKASSEVEMAGLRDTSHHTVSRADTPNAPLVPASSTTPSETAEDDLFGENDDDGVHG